MAAPNNPVEVVAQPTIVYYYVRDANLGLSSSKSVLDAGTGREVHLYAGIDQFCELWID